MPFYNIAMRSSELARVISDCYQILGRRQTIELLDDMNQLGFRESDAQRSVVRDGRSDHARSEGQDHRRSRKGSVMKFNKLYQRGIITEGNVTTRCSTPGRTLANRSRPK